MKLRWILIFVSWRAACPAQAREKSEYLKTNAQLARDLTDEIDAIIDYGQNKAKLDFAETIPGLRLNPKNERA